MVVTGLMSEDLEPRQTAAMSLLQYMVGNTDFSFTGRHNLEFVNVKGQMYPIIFDYDQSGLINASYATPDPQLNITSVTQRVYRGLCVPPDTITAVLADMKTKRSQIEGFYRDDVGKLMGGQAVAHALDYIGDFYSEMDNPKNVQKNILNECAKAR
jgi:hypothetical protein